MAQHHTPSHPAAPEFPPTPGERLERIGPDRRLDAIRRLVAVDAAGDPEHAERFLAFASRNEIDLEHLWSVVDARGRIVATALAVPNPGRTAMVFASHPLAREDVPRHGRLLSHVCDTLGPADVHLAQVLLELSELREKQACLAGGFRELATLSYLQRPARGRRRPPPAWPPGVEPVPYAPALDEALLATLEASYEGTLDCPGLYGLREGRDILEGHRATGRFDPSLWTLLRVDGRFAGAVLLNPCPAQRSIELVYIGLAAPARGRGLGRELLRHALALVEPREERAISLAVDERNAPAVRLYAREGFQRVLRRVALIRPIQR